MAVSKIVPFFVVFAFGVASLSFLPQTATASGVEKRQAECYNPFHKPPWCYGYGFGFGAPGFGFGFGAPGFGAGFGPFGVGVGGGFGFGPDFEEFGAGAGAGVGFSTKFGAAAGEDEDEEEASEDEDPVKVHKAKLGLLRKPQLQGRPGHHHRHHHRRPFTGVGAFAGGGFGPGFDNGFGFNPWIPDFGDMPTVKTSGNGFSTTAGSSTFTFGPEGKTSTSTSNQMATIKAKDATWTVQSSGIKMEAGREGSTIRVVAHVGKPTHTEKELVSAHEVQFNFSYGGKPKKWINLKVDEHGPNLAGVNLQRGAGGVVLIRGPN